MTRKAVWCGLPFLAGVLLFCGAENSFAALVIAAAALTVIALLCLRKYRVYAAAVGVSVLCGLTCGKAYALFHISPALSLDGRTVEMKGIVTEVSDLGGDRFRLTIDGKADGVSAKIIFFAGQGCEPYSEVNVTGKVTALTDTARFPSKSYYLPKGIYLQGNAETLELTGGKGSLIMRGVTALRDYTAGCIAASADKESAAFLTAILCGDRSDMSEVTKTKLYRAGVGHLFALSGTHLAVIAVIFSTIFRTVIRSRRKRLVLLEAVILLFVAFGGFSPSLIRAGIMTSLVFCSQLAGRRADPLSSLGVCAVIMCGVNPFVCLSGSFQCSFLSCFAICAVAPKLTALLPDNKTKFILEPMVDSAVIVSVMMPMLALNYNEVSLIAPVTNLLIVPLCTAALTLSVMAMLLGGAILPAKMIFHLADLCVRLLLRLTDFFASIGFSAVGCRRVIPLLAGAAVLAAVMIFAVKLGRLRIFALGTTAVFVGLWTVQSTANVMDKDTIRLKLYGGSSGVCAVISSGGSCVLLDIGAKGAYNYGVQRYLSYNGTRRCKVAFVAQELGASAYLTGLYPAPESIRTEYGYYSEPFVTGTQADLGEYTVRRLEDGYAIGFDGGEYTVTKDRVTLPDGSWLPAEELKKYPELVLVRG